MGGETVDLHIRSAFVKRARLTGKIEKKIRFFKVPQDSIETPCFFLSLLC